MDKTELVAFVKPFYENKDMMHNMGHINLVSKWVQKVLSMGNYAVDEDALTYATHFHGCVKGHEQEIRAWLKLQGVNTAQIEKIITIAKESMREKAPISLEGKILHDAHLLEGGKTYIVTKCLITGSLRGQTLQETIDYMEKNIVDNAVCYLPETIPLMEEANEFAKAFVKELKEGTV